MDKSELVELVRRIMSVDGSEAEIDAWIDIVSREVPDPEWTDLVYYDDRELSPEQVVDEAMAYKPILL